MKMITRHIFAQITKDLKRFPAVVLLGPRQVGKTTFVKNLIQKTKNGIYLDLELPSDLIQLNDIEFFLTENRKNLIAFDEVQRKPELFEVARAVIDQKIKKGMYFFLGSASPELVSQSAETLAGRVVYREMLPIHLLEVKQKDQSRLKLVGGFPLAFTAKTYVDAFAWLQAFVSTYVERDLAILGLKTNSKAVNRLFRMLASIHGTTLNSSMLSKSLGISNTAIKQYLDYLESAMLIRRLEPYFVNTRKRLVKSPKIYIRDVGILHSLFDIQSNQALNRHYMKGNSWEGFVIQQIISKYNDDYSYQYYRTQDGSELDLIIVKGVKPMYAIEVKTTNNPQLNKGNYYAFEAIKAKKNYVITPGSKTFSITKNIKVCSLWNFLNEEF